MVGRALIIFGVCACVLAAQSSAPAVAGGAAAQGPPTFTLAEALQRAKANSVDFQAAVAAQGIAASERTVARAAALPSVSYNQNYFWTQSNRYVADDGPHEYQSLGGVHEALNFGTHASLARARAGVALANAQAEIAARGLAVTVTQAYYNLLAADHKIITGQQAVQQAQSYLRYSQDRERAGEVAHADVIKAQLQMQQQQNALTEDLLAQDQAKLALAVLLFPNFDTNFNVADDLTQVPPLPPQAQVQALATQHNPTIAAAQAQLQQAQNDVSIARAGLLPSASLDYSYGIDAHQFATENRFNEPNLASKVSGMLSIPVFDWGGLRAKVHEAELLRSNAQRQASLAQRQLLANLQGFYNEAKAAHDELDLLASSADLAADSLRMTGLRYQNGDATILELVDAQNSLTAARDAYDDGEVRYRVALANLQTLTGAF